MHYYGLLTSSNSNSGPSVDLESSAVEVTVRGFVAHLSVDLTYRNKSETTLEVTYICPVDVRAAVYSFEAKLEGRTITAHCLEKKKAKEAYTEAVKQGHTAILGSEDELSGDLLHLSLGNLPKGETVELKLKIVMELLVKVDGAVTFTLPTVFNPRYSPSDQPAGPMYSAPVLNTKVFPNKVPYSLSVKGKVLGSFKIAKISSHSDPINVHLSDEETSAEITQDGGSNFDHDWSFQIFYQTVHSPHCLQMPGDRTSKGLMKDDVLMLNLFPEVPLEGYSPHNEIIFVVDRSGSMNGSKIQRAKTTLLLFLKSLPSGCRFNIISFGSAFSALFENSSERYTEESLQKALVLQKSMGADMGGTEIFSALKYVYSKSLVPGYARQMIVLTDGEVWNLEQIFDLISRHAEETRVFSVGIGDGASSALVQGIADAGRGRSEMVVDENQLQTKVMGLVASMLQENVKDLKVECEVTPSQNFNLVPKISPVVFGGQHLILYARFKPKSEIKSIKSCWTVGEKKMACEINEKECRIVHDSNFSFHRLAAKAQLKQWERDDDETLQDEIINLSVLTSVVCRSTAFIGIDQDRKTIQEEKTITEGTLEMDSIAYGHCAPKMKTFVGGGSRGICFGQSSQGFMPRAQVGGGFTQKQLQQQACLPPPSPPSFAPQLFGKKSRSKVASSMPESAALNSVSLFSYCGGGADSSTVSEDAVITDSLIEIISSQNFKGSWSIDDALKLVGITEKQFKDIQNKLALNDICTGTVLILAYLEAKYSARKQEWQFVSLKGRKYLEQENISPDKMIENCARELEQII